MAGSGEGEALQCSRIFIGGLLLHDNIPMIDNDETEQPDVISREDVKHLKTLCSNIARQNCDQSECLVATLSIAIIYSSRTASPIIIYSSRTASSIYISAEQHRPYILQQNRGD